MRDGHSRTRGFQLGSLVFVWQTRESRVVKARGLWVGLDHTEGLRAVAVHVLPKTWFVLGLGTRSSLA